MASQSAGQIHLWFAKDQSSPNETMGTYTFAYRMTQADCLGHV